MLSNWMLINYFDTMYNVNGFLLMADNKITTSNQS